MSNTSFLPEDYLAQKAERRTNIICLTLFAVVMSLVLLAFLATNSKLRTVTQRREDVNIRFQQAALEIQELTTLEEQKERMLDKAELAGSLVERVPRSILLAELINRMPPRLGLVTFEMTSEKIRSMTKQPEKNATGSLKGKPARAKTMEQAKQEVNKIEAPRYAVNVVMIGVAPTDLEVSRFMAELNAYELLQDVDMKYSEETEFDERKMREFRIEMTLDPNADVSSIDPLVMPRNPKNPMSDELKFVQPGQNVIDNADTDNEAGDN